MNKVEKLFAAKAIIRGGILLFSKNDALCFVKECKKNGIVILGIDGFFLTRTATRPSLEDSVDYSSLLKIDYEKIMEFIRKSKNELYFEIVCE